MSRDSLQGEETPEGAKEPTAQVLSGVLDVIVEETRHITPEYVSQKLTEVLGR